MPFPLPPPPQNQLVQSKMAACTYSPLLFCTGCRVKLAPVPVQAPDFKENQNTFFTFTQVPFMSMGFTQENFPMACVL